MERAIVVAEAASVLGSPRDVRSRMISAEGVGDESEIAAGRFDLRGRGIMKVDDEIKPIISSVPRLIWNVTTAPAWDRGLTSLGHLSHRHFRGNVS